MDIRWQNRSFKYPAIFIVKTGSKVGEGWVIVIQYPTPSEAHEEAGSTKNGFSWGRFMIYGDPNLVEEIKSRL